MGLLDSLKRATGRGFGEWTSRHDFAEDDAFLDAIAITEETRRSGPLGLAAMPAMVAGGRIQWDKVLAGCPNVVYHPGWERRGAPVMNPVAMLWHWTAVRATAARPAPCLGVCINGRPDLPGPIVQLHIDFSGVITVIASGRANHAGRGHQQLLERMRAGLPPLGSAKELRLPDTGGFGGSLAGVEIENNGTDPLSAAQLRSIGNLGRACQSRLGFNLSQAGRWHHRATTQRKVDLDDAKMAQIAAVIATTVPVPKAPAPVLWHLPDGAIVVPVAGGRPRLLDGPTASRMRADGSPQIDHPQVPYDR